MYTLCIISTRNKPLKILVLINRHVYSELLSLDSITKPDEQFLLLDIRPLYDSGPPSQRRILQDNTLHYYTLHYSPLVLVVVVVVAEGHWCYQPHAPDT